MLHSQLNISCWNVHSYQLKDQCISVLPHSKICLSVCIQMLLSTLLKTFTIIIAYSLVLPYFLLNYLKVFVVICSQHLYFDLDFTRHCLYYSIFQVALNMLWHIMAHTMLMCH